MTIRTWWLALVSALVLLAACQGKSGEDITLRPTGATAQAGNGCMVELHGKSFRAGDDIPVRMALRNVGTWCFGGFGFSGVSSGGTTLVNKPENGDARMLPRQSGFLFGYRPHPGFTGSDSFVIAVPSGYGVFSNLSVTVVVGS